MRFRRKRDSEKAPEWQPRLYLTLIALGLLIAYVIAFVVENSTEVPIHWVFETTHASLIWVIIVSLTIGIFVGVLLSQLHRRRWRRRHPREDGGQPADSVGDLRG